MPEHHHAKPAGEHIARHPLHGHILRKLGVLVITQVAVLVGLAGCATSVHAVDDDSLGASLANPEPVGALSHVGRWLTDSTGRVVFLHGVNMVSKEAPYYPEAFGFNDADADLLATNGLEVVRLGVLATGLMPTPGRVDVAYLDHLASTVRMLGRHHIFVLLDLHQDGFGPTVGSDGFPDWMTLTGSAINNHAGFPTYYTSDPATQQAFQSLYDNAAVPGGAHLQDYLAQMLHALAGHFAESRNVIGYDIYNEPWPGTTWIPCLVGGGCPSLDHGELDPLYSRVDQAIRSADHSHLLFVEPFALFNLGTAPTSLSLPGSDRASGLSFHQYSPSVANAPSVLADATAWAGRTGGALLDTEWGATTNAAAITSQAAQFDQAMIPWIFWAFTAELVGNLSQAPSGSNVIASTAGALIRPYPFLVAGTPTSIAYDPGTHHFATSWSTVEPDGHRLRAGAVTTIEVPAMDYPSGYTVSVTGARVTSRRCAPKLTLANEGRVSSVMVTVTPGGSCKGETTPGASDLLIAAR